MSELTKVQKTILGCRASDWRYAMLGHIMIRIYRFARYEEEIILQTQNLMALSSASRDEIKSAIPVLRDPPAMRIRLGFAKWLRALNGEIADEVHEFANAH